MLTMKSKWLFILLIVSLIVSIAPQIALAESPGPGPRLNASGLPATYNISVSPTSGPSNTSVTVSSNNAPRSSPINIIVGTTSGTDGWLVATSTSDNLGRFKVTFRIGAANTLTAGDQYGVWAISNPGTSNKASSNVVVYSTAFDLNITPTSGLLRTVVTVTGSSAPANSTVTIFVGDKLGGQGVAAKSLKADRNGYFKTTITIGDVGNPQPGTDIGIFAQAGSSGSSIVPSTVEVFHVSKSTVLPSFTQLSPGPYNTLSPGWQVLGATVRSDSKITSVVLILNGEQQSIAAFDPATKVVVAYSKYLYAGSYVLTMAATDKDGDAFIAQWDFVVGTQGESQWFMPGAAAKPDNFNATMKSLVEAYRYHLYGQSWDGARHAELPSHFSNITNGSPLKTWARADGTLDQAYTEATLRSLVEAFRWHLFGISWQASGTPGMVTHATTFTGPQSIDPWFDASGKPIRGNVEATMESLVQAMRWHFWGYSWDGGNHPNIPSHAGA
jgi:hypothetical protein